MQQTRPSGFTLAELLISLAILGVITTFTIPKILTAQQNEQNKAKAKEVAAMISGAYQQAQVAGLISSATKPTDITPYMNYISVDTTSLIDSHVSWAGNAGGGKCQCSANTPCLKLHNGGVLMAGYDLSFGGFATTNVIEFLYDPDTIAAGGTVDGPSKSVQFQLYYNGFLTSRSFTLAGTRTSAGNVGAISTADPTWFSW
jgi:prepilin-type N-terminal cleavage/methylation domain-containing protein